MLLAGWLIIKYSAKDWHQHCDGKSSVDSGVKKLERAHNNLDKVIDSGL